MFMEINIQNLIDFLLENASVSIRYRVKREILNVPVESEEMQKLQAEILDLPRVKKAFAVQKEDGFLGNVLHGGYVIMMDLTLLLICLKDTVLKWIILIYREPRKLY